MGYRYSRRDRRQLRERWKGQEARISAIIGDIQASQRRPVVKAEAESRARPSGLRAIIGQVTRHWFGKAMPEERSAMASSQDSVARVRDWTKHLRAVEELGWDELPLLSTCPSQFHIPGEAAPRDLRGLHLEEVNLSGTEGLSNTSMDLSTLQAVLLQEATMTGVSLRHARIDHSCVLERADLQYSDLRYADFNGALMDEANLTLADLRGASFEDCSLKGSILRSVRFSDFTRESLLGLLGLSGSCSRFGGEDQTSRDPDERSDPSLKRYIDRCNQRRLFTEQHPTLALAMRWLSNYLYSPMRVLFWAFVIWILFGLLYADLQLPKYLEHTVVGDVLQWLNPEFSWGVEGQTRDWFDAFYLSAATLTGLGAESIEPVNWFAQAYASAQGFLGVIVMAVLVASVLRGVGES